MENKAQASLELLMLIGGAVIVATAIGLYLKSISTKATQNIVERTSAGLS